MVLYRSEDVRGNPIATSGIVVLPTTPAPPEGYPVISPGARHRRRRRSVPSHGQPGSAAHPMNAFPQRLLNHFLRRMGGEGVRAAAGGTRICADAAMVSGD